MQYHYLLTGLDDLQLGKKTALQEADLLALLEEQMTPSDWQYILQLRKRGDDADIKALMQDDAVLDRFHQTSLSEDDFRTQLLYAMSKKFFSICSKVVFQCLCVSSFNNHLVAIG